MDRLAELQEKLAKRKGQPGMAENVHLLEREIEKLVRESQPDASKLTGDGE